MAAFSFLRGVLLLLRQLVDVLDRVDQHAGFDPMNDLQLVLADEELTDAELSVAVPVRRG